MLAEQVVGRGQGDALLVAGPGHVVSAAVVVSLGREQSGVSFVAGAGHVVPAAGAPVGEASAESSLDIVDSTHDVSFRNLDTWRWCPRWLCVS